MPRTGRGLKELHQRGKGFPQRVPEGLLEEGALKSGRWESWEIFKGGEVQKDSLPGRGPPERERKGEV